MTRTRFRVLSWNRAGDAVNACGGWALAAMALAGATLARAQLSPNGGEFQVNTYTTGSQESPSVSADGQGRFVVAWESFGSNGTDTSSTSIHVQRLDVHGTPVGAELQVNTFTPSDQRFPVVAGDDLGRFVVVWESYGSAGTDTSNSSNQGQLFDADGTPLGGEFQVNTYTTAFQGRPAVAMDTLGQFVVVWESNGSSGTDTSEYSVLARRYDSAGAALGADFQVNSYTTSFQRSPAVAADGLGNFIVVWTSFGSSGTDTSNNGIQGQRYDAAGAALGAEFQVNSYTTSYQFSPAVAADGQGNFVVVWGSAGSSGTDTSSSSIQGQRYDSAGSALGSQFQVNTSTTYNQHQPAVAFDGQGDFVVAWQSESSGGSDSSDYSVQIQRYRADGVPRDGEIQVNTYTTTHQGSPSVAADARGNFLVSWDSTGSAGADTASASVQAQRYDGLFRDGFESSDTSRWSATVPL